MSEERTRILGLLADGKITAAEAERLLDAVGGPSSAPEAPAAPAAPVPPRAPGQAPKFMYVKVISADGDNVDVKVPLALVRSGLKLTSLIPPQVMGQISDSMADSDVPFDLGSLDLGNLKPEETEELIEGLAELEVNVDAANGDNVRVWCA